MRTAIVTGSGGLVGSESVRALVEAGFRVIGLENDTRAQLFGSAASTAPQTRRLLAEYPEFSSIAVDVRDTAGVERLFRQNRRELELVIHTAAQPSHDWASSQPQVDFAINANGTLNLLEATRLHAPDATFVFTSTNKVYGDRPNALPLVELATRLELPEDHCWHGGIDTSMSIDTRLHSLFGASKAAADLLVQEYGRYFGLRTVCFRCGCLTGPAHAGTELHGFLSYLMRCAVSEKPYTVFGYGGKQVRDNLASVDLVKAFLLFHADPRAGAVYNLGGGRSSSCSMLEAIATSERIAGKSLDWTLSDEARIGDHRWWISDLAAFQADYPTWAPTLDTEAILRAIHDANVEQWAGTAIAA
jgi:CDP-paratose 2-epimerase